jgi:intein/homing endonuclease
MKEYKTGRWSIYEINLLKELYGNINTDILADRLNRSKVSIHLKANRSGFKFPEKYAYDIDYFESIDSQDKAYWLGFIFADGCVIYNKKDRCYEFSIHLKKTDDGHLRKLNNCLNGNVIVTYHTAKPFVHKGYDKEYETCIIRFYSIKLVRDLIDKGVYQNKTNRLVFPTYLNEELTWHFIRGFMDGDGHLCIPNDGDRYGYRVGFTSNSRNFLESLQRVLSRHNIVSHVNRDKSSHKLEIRERKSVKKFIDNTYNNANIFLDRKYDTYLKLNALLSPLEMTG